MIEKTHIFEAELGPQSDLQDFFRDNIVVIRTGFFRSAELYSTLADTILPELESQLSEMEPIRVWSAGCSDGREPYSIAMAMKAFYRENGIPRRFSITASDISPEQIDSARHGAYKVGAPELAALRRFANDYKETSDGDVTVADHIRNLVTFRCENIFTARFPKKFHLIFMTNVLLYYEKEFRKDIVTEIGRRLENGGYFYLESVGSKYMKNIGLERIRSNSHYHMKTDFSRSTNG